MQPNFWRHKNLISILLSPFAALYCLGSKIRNIAARPYRAKIPVICVGNATVGGAGKTPIVISLTKLLRANKSKVAITSRGYKGSIKKPTLIDTKFHTAYSVGDEPLLLCNIAPTYIAKTRANAIKMAEQKQPDIIIMDDGLQNPTIAKDLSFLVIDGKYGIGNSMVIPSGPMRDIFESSLKNSDAVILMGDDETSILQNRAFLKYPNIPILRAKLEVCENAPSKEPDYIAFAGIGNPDKFFSTLKDNQYKVIKEIKYADHYNYSDRQINKLIHLAEDQNAMLITTEKDAVRLPSFAQNKIKALPVEVVWQDLPKLQIMLEKIVSK